MKVPQQILPKRFEICDKNAQQTILKKKISALTQYGTASYRCKQNETSDGLLSSSGDKCNCRKTHLSGLIRVGDRDPVWSVRDVIVRLVLVNVLHN